MSRKRGSLSPRTSRSGRKDSRSSSFVDSNGNDDRQQQLLKQERTLSRKMSYKPEAATWPHQDQIEYLLDSARSGDWEVVGDILEDLLGTQEEDPLKSLLLTRTKEFTDVLSRAAGSGNERVVKLLTERGLVEIYSSKYETSFLRAAEEGYAGVMRCLLRHYKHVSRISPEDFKKFLNAPNTDTEMRNTALHFACGAGQRSKEGKEGKEGLVAVLKELLDEFLPDLNLNVINANEDTPLHVAITRALETDNLEIVDMLCTKGKKKLLLNKKNKEGKTPYQRLWDALLKTDDKGAKNDTVELMRQMFLKQKPVNDRRDESYRERDYLQNVATSLLVGATLLVSVTFGGFLQMPKLPPDHDFMELGATVLNASSDLGSRKYLYVRAIDIFRCTNAISFFMSIISIIYSIRVMISRRDRTFIETEVSELERSIRVASIALTLSTAVAVVAFVSSGLANIPVAESGWSFVISRWQKSEYVPLYQSTTLMTSLLGSLFVAPIVVLPLAKDYYFFWMEFKGDPKSVHRFLSLLYATCLIFTVLLLVVMVVFGMGLL